MARDIRVKVIGDTSAFEAAMNRSSSSLARFAKTAALGAGAAGVGAVVTGMTLAAKSAIDFEKEMRNVNSIAHLGDKQFAALSKSVTGMAAEVGQKPKVLASGLYDIVSSGFKASDAVKILRVSAKAATAGLTDTATSAKAVTASLNAYHLGADQARKVSDVLFQTVNKGVLTFEELSSQMGDLVPAAAPLGVSLEEVGASMATLTLQGVGAEEAATRVKNAMLALAKPTPALAKLLKEQGFASGEAAVKAKGFAGVLDLLSKATNGSVAAQAALTPNVRTLLGVVGLTGKNLQTYTDNLNAMKQGQMGAGVTAKVFAEQSKSVAVQWQKLSAQIDVFLIQAGNHLLPLLSDLTKKASAFAKGWDKAGTSANDAHKDLDLLAGSMRGLGEAADWTAKKLGGWSKVAGVSKTILEQMTGIAALKEAQTLGKVLGFGANGAGAGSGGTGGATVGALTGGGGSTKNQGAAIAAVAQTQLGISYQWGGPAILGQHTDCSGLAQAVLAKNGIHVGRTTYEQWSQGKPTMQPQAGDLVFFHMGPKGPEHVGIYIGNGNFIHDPHTGSEVKVESLSNMSGYCGARTYVSQTSGGGGSATLPDPTSATAPASSSAAGKKTAKKTLKIPNFDLPVSIRTAIAQASLTVKDSADDLKALGQAKQFIQSKLGSLTGEQKIQALDALKGINDQITGIENAAQAKQAAALKAAMAEKSAAYRKQVADVKAALTLEREAWAKHASDLQAIAADAIQKLKDDWTNAGSQVMDGFDSATTRALDKMRKDYAAVLMAFDRETQKGLDALSAVDQTPDEKALADFIAERSTADHAAKVAQLQEALATAQAGGDPAAIKQAQEALNQQTLDDQQAALKVKADASRKAADAAAKIAQDDYQQQRNDLKSHMDDQEKILEDGYSNQRDIEKRNLDSWLAYQEQQLETGKGNWETFMQQLIALSNTYGFAIGAELQNSFQSAFGDGGTASAASRAAATATAAIPYLGVSGAVKGGLDPAIALAMAARGAKLFDSGGVLPPGLSLAMNMTGKPEAVLTGAQLASAAGGGNIYTTVILDGEVVGRSVQKWAANDRMRGGSGVPG